MRPFLYIVNLPLPSKQPRVNLLDAVREAWGVGRGYVDVYAIATQVAMLVDLYHHRLELVPALRCNAV